MYGKSVPPSVGGGTLLRITRVKGPVTRIIDPLFLSLCLVLPLSKIRAAKTASLDVSSEARYSPRKFMQNTHLMLVSDLRVFELFS